MGGDVANPHGGLNRDAVRLMDPVIFKLCSGWKNYSLGSNGVKWPVLADTIPWCRYPNSLTPLSFPLLTVVPPALTSARNLHSILVENSGRALTHKEVAALIVTTPANTLRGILRAEVNEYCPYCPANHP